MNDPDASVERAEVILSLSSRLTDKQWLTAMQWVTYVSERHIEIYEHFLETQIITDTLYQISIEPVMINGAPVTFPLNIREAHGKSALMAAALRLIGLRIELPYALCNERKKIVASKTWRRRDTQRNWEAFVDVVLSRMAIEGKHVGMIYADDSINATMKKVHGRSLSCNTLKIFKAAWAELEHGSVVPGIRDHHDKGTVYALALDVPVHGKYIYPYASNEVVDEWLKPYEDAYSCLQDHETQRALDNIDFKNQLKKVLACAEEIVSTVETPKPSGLVVRGRLFTFNEGQVMRMDL